MMQAQAAELLSRPQTSSSHEPASVYSSALAVVDAQARAAALLSGVPAGHGAKSSPVSATSETLGQHPAVLVAQQWSTRGIDPNTFIVAHPARLELLAAPVTEMTPVSRPSASR
jgi:hypothetical protein